MHCQHHPLKLVPEAGLTERVHGTLYF